MVLQGSSPSKACVHARAFFAYSNGSSSSREPNLCGNGFPVKYLRSIQDKEAAMEGAAPSAPEKVAIEGRPPTFSTAKLYPVKIFFGSAIVTAKKGSEP